MSVNTHCETVQRFMAAKLNRLTLKTVILQCLMAESCSTCHSRSKWCDGELSDIPSHIKE